MKQRGKHYLGSIFLAGMLAFLLQACSIESDSSSDEDTTAPVTTLTSLNDGEEVVGTYRITWTTTEVNRSTVALYISNDSGATWALMESTLPDTGEFSWDSNSVDDCRRCRLRVVQKDIVGNVGAPADSAQDFIVNNVPQVLGIAYYRDVGNDGPGDEDELRVPFDKDLELRTSIASDIFAFPVLGDSVGSFAEISRSPSNPRELLITMNDLSSFDFHLHVRGLFNPNKLGRTAPSGINLLTNISEGVIFAPDTGRTADAAESGIDIVPTFNDSGQPLLVPVLSQANGVEFGDVDGDGDLDLVQGYFDLFNFTSADEPNRVLLNGGDNSGSNTGVFIDSGQALGNNSTGDIALGDVDGDGDLDMVEGNNKGQANRVWLNNINNIVGQEGVFTDSGQMIGADTTNAIALGDVDGDGDLDLVTGNDGANRVWLNGGDSSGSNTGVFGDSGQTLGNSATNAIELGDVDGDKDLDLLTGNLVWLNGGDSTGSNTGVFSDSGQALGNTAPSYLALGDVDGDGDLDLVKGGFGTGVLVWLNGGDNSGSNTGVFSDSGQALSKENSTIAIALADIDDDGDLDLVTGDFREPNRVFYNDGSGSFTDSGEALGNNSTYAIALGDVDGDGDLDLAANLLFLNSLSSTEFFIETDQLEFFGSTVSKVTLGDIDGDDDLDLVATTSGSPGSVRFFTNNGAGNFTDSGQILDNFSTRAVALGDIDGDGDLDLVSGSKNRVWLNGGDGSGSNTGLFIDTGQNLGNYFIRAITLGDVDGDGDLDLVAGVAGNSGEPNRVFFNDGSGGFTDSGQALGNNFTLAVALADVDGDKDLDLVAGNFSNEPNRVWLNGGDSSGSNTGVFSDSLQALGSSRTWAIALGDVDGDGDVDVNGDGDCDDDVDVDINGDDDCDLDLDLVVGNLSESNRVWLNGGDNSGSNTGVFSDSGQALGNDATRAIALEDIDRDGDLDLISGNDGQPNLVRLNGGDSSGSNTGQFGDPASQALGNNDTSDLTFGDIDGDGDRDHLEAGNDLQSANITIWLNDF